MRLRTIAAVCTALTLAGTPAFGQAGTPSVAPAAPEAERKPALQVKPATWTPKVIHRSQLRPHLKPVFETDAGDDVYVPPSQINAMPAARPTAAAVPVSLAPATAIAAPAVQHASVQPTVTATPNPLPPAALQDFVGRFLGAGVEVALAPSPTEPPRRMSQVEITGDANEFTVKWATMRIGANFKPETVKSSQQELLFRPSGTPGRYVAVALQGAGAAPDAVAEVQGRTMIVTVNAALPTGQKSIQRYERTLTDRGMDVVFTRTEGGRLVRQVNLTLTRGGSSLWRGL